MQTMNFKISARLMQHMGDALISDELVALMELIKNSYDADSNFCSIKIDTDIETNYGSGEITIKDDGNGMTSDIIQNSFLRLATDYKTKEAKFSQKFKRLSLGNKGVGRLSLQRLGSVTKIITKNTDKDAIELLIDWRLFNDPDKELDQIEVEVDTNPSLNEKFKNGHGTLIIISGLKNNNFWEDEKTKQKFEKEMMSIIDPYSVDSRTKFTILLEINNFIFSSEKYDVKLLENLADTIVDFYFSEKTKELEIKISRNRKYIDYQFRKMKDKRGEIFKIVKNDDQDFYFDAVVEKKYDFNNKFEIHKRAKLIAEDGEYFLPGDFSGKFFAFDKSLERTKENKKTLDLMNGVKLFRNNFRIVPYGDPKNDWLSLTEYSQQIKSNIFKLHTVAGYVYIDGETNLNKLKEMTNRQGLIEDNYGKNFLTIMSDIITLFAVEEDISLRENFTVSSEVLDSMIVGSSREIRNGTIKLTKISDNFSEIKIHTKAVSEMTEPNILDSNEDSELKINLHSRINKITAATEKAALQVKQYKDLYEEERKKLDSYKEAVGASIVSEALAHEILGISKKIKNNLKSIKTICKSSETDVHLELILSSLGYLDRYASVLDTNSYTKRKKFEVIDIKNYIQNIVSSFPIFDSNVDSEFYYEIIGENFESEIIKTNIKIAIENLIINSKFWTKDWAKKPTVFFEFDSSNKTIKIWDNGPGINKKIENSIFDQYVTGKPGNTGRGMGLFITRLLLEEIGATIYLLDEKNTEGNLHKFCISFA